MADINKTEVKVMVEYIIEMPPNILLTEVDDFIKNEIDEGADAKSIRHRTVTDIAFAERPGIVDSYHVVRAAMGMVKDVLEAEEEINDHGAIVEAIKPIVNKAIEEAGDEPDED